MIVELPKDTDLPTARALAADAIPRRPWPHPLRIEVPWAIGATRFYTRIAPEVSEWCQETLRHPVQWAVGYYADNPQDDEGDRYIHPSQLYKLLATFGSPADLIAFRMRWE